MGDGDAFSRNTGLVGASGMLVAGGLHESEHSAKPSRDTGSKFDGSEPCVFRLQDKGIWIVIQHQILADRLRK